MALTSKREKKEVREPIKPGTYQAVCYGLYDIGKQFSKRYEKYNRQVVILWEIPELLIDFVDKDGNKKTAPRAISMTCNNVLGEKATLRKLLESWRGRPFTEEELDGFDLTNILKKNCLLQIMHKKAENNNIYSNIVNILPLLKGMPVKEPVAQIQQFSMEEDMNIPDYTPNWIKEKILASVEFASMKEKEPNVEADAGISQMIPEDDCPF